MILGIQILGLLFGLFMIYYSFLSFKKKEFRKREFVLWMIIWILFIMIALFPNMLNPIISSLSVSRRMDLLIIVGFMFLIGLGFSTYIVARKNRKKIENIVREIAIKKEK
jgi:hypothetical protein